MRKLFVFAIAIIIGVGLLCFKPWTERRNIKRVLAQSELMAERVKSKTGLVDKFWSAANIVGKIEAGLSQIDLSSCPDDFREAFLRHVAAWAAYERFAQKTGGWHGFMTGFMTTFTGGPIAMIPAYRDAYREGTEAEAHINKTHQDLLLIAQRHGVIMPRK